MRSTAGPLPAAVTAEPLPVDPRPQPQVRTPLAVIVSRFPLVTETFVLREIMELERQGQPVVLVPLLRERPAVVHRQALPWVRRALYTPFLSPAIAAANLRCLRRRPAAWLRLLARLVLGHAASPGALVRTLALFPKTVYLAERLEQEGVGHVHAHFTTYPGTAAYAIHRLTGLSYSLTAHAHDIFVRRDMLAPKLAAASFVRCISEFNRDFLRARYPRHARVLTVVHMGLPVAAPPAAVPDRAEGPPRLLCVAALKAYKGHAVLLRALARLRERGLAVSCDLVGEGPLRARIEAQIAAAGLGGHVRLLGARTQDEVAALMASAAAVVQPSVVARDGQMEGIPVALMEAMAAGKPVVASALSGIPELVEDGLSGLLVPPGDVEALAAALQRVLTEPPLAAWLGEQGRRAVVREYELTATAGAVLAAVDRHRRSAPPAWIARVAAHVPGAAAGLRRVHERRDSGVAEIVLPEPGGEVVLKVHRTEAGEPSGPAARREFDVLCRLDQHWRARSGEARFATPRPLGLDEGAGALLMTACPGEVLAERVRRLRWRRDALHEGLLADLRDTGGWLRAFQEHAPAAGGAVALEALARTASADADAAGLPQAVRRRALERLSAAVERLDAAALPTCGRHGDFWPGNVFVDEDRVEVVDLEGYGPGLACEDAAYFLVQVGLFYSYPSLRARRRAAEEAFLAGYLDGTPLDPDLWTACWTAKVLHVLARTRTGAARGPLRAWWRRRALVQMLEARP